MIDAITHQLGKLLIKAIGDEDDMLAWDKFRRNPPVKMNPAKFIEGIRKGGCLFESRWCSPFN